jgi:hypothetical protein
VETVGDLLFLHRAEMASLIDFDDLVGPFDAGTGAPLGAVARGVSTRVELS